MVRSLAENLLIHAPPKVGNRDRLILAYHNVVDDAHVGVGDESLHMRVDKFEKQMKLITASADVVSVTELLSTSPMPTDRLAAITFDDAYRGALELALPICSALALATTVFVSPGLLGTVPAWDILASMGKWTSADRERFLWCSRGRAENLESTTLLDALRIGTEAELLEAIGHSVHCVANHSFSHANLGALTLDQARVEIDLADAWLKSRFESSYQPIIAYPYGIMPSFAQQLAEGDSQFAGVLVSGGWIKDGTHLDRWAIPRWNVPAGISTNGFQLRLHGWFSQTTS